MPKLLFFLKRPLVILLAGCLLILVLFPDPADALLQNALERARTAAMHGRADAAFQAVQEAVALDPALTRLDVAAGRLALEAGLNSEANDLLQAALAHNPDQLEATCLLGWVRLQQGQLDAAEQLQSPRCPNHNRFLASLRAAHLANGSLEQAYRIAELHFTYAPGNLEVLESYALVMAAASPDESLPLLRAVLENQEQPEELVLDLIRAIEDTAPESDSAYSLATVGQTFVRYQRWQLASGALRMALDLEPDYPEALAYLGYIQQQLGQDGREALQAAWEMAPNSTLSALFYANHLSASGEGAQAIDVLETALGQQPEEPALFAQLGHTYAAEGDIEAARNAFLQAVDLAPEDPHYWRALASFSLQAEVEVATLGLPAARNAYIQSDGSNPDRDLIGYAHLLLGDLDLAARLLSESIQSDPAFPSAWLHWGLLQQMRGNLEAAEFALDIAVRLEPNGPSGQRAARVLENIRR